MLRPEPALRLTHHRTGIEVKIGYRRSWLTTLNVARRILAARVHAHDKGLAKVLSTEADWEVREVSVDQFSAIAEIDGEIYTVTLKPENP